MAHIILPHRWRQQPQTPVEIDWAHPLARGLFDLHVFSTAHAYGNLVDARRSLSRPANHSLLGTQAGVGARFRGNGSSAGNAAYRLLSGIPATATAVSMAVVGADSDRSDYDQTQQPAIYGVRASTSNSWLGFDRVSYTSGADVRFIATDNSYSSASTTQTGALTAGRRFSFVGTARLSGVVRLYAGGREVGFVAAPTGARFLPYDECVVVGAAYGSAYEFPAGVTVSLAAIWLRELSAGEARDFDESPWQILKPSQRRIWVSRGSAGQTYNESLTEAVSAADAASSALVAAASAAEPASASDALSSTQVAASAIAEAAPAAESSGGDLMMAASGTEAAAASDAPGATIVVGAGVSEGAAAIDGSAAATQAVAGATEAAAATDAMSALLVAAASSTEAAAAAEQSTSSAVLVAAITEAATAGDSSTGSIGAQTHDVAITEAASAGVAAAASAVLAASASEGGVAAEDAASTAVMAAAASEAASASESASAAIGASTYNVSATEVASAADSSVADVAIAAHASEGVSAADAAGASAVLVAQAAEAVEADDHASSTLHAVAVLVESVSAADAIVVSADFVRSIVEPAAATDWSEATIGAQTYNVSIVEAAHASDAAVIVAAFGARAPGWRGAVNAGAGRPAAIQTARRPASRG